jgi:hypothetical protein
MKALLAVLLLAGSPAMAQETDCRGQAHTAERELQLNQQLSPGDRLLAERQLSRGSSLCDTDPARGSRDIERLRRDNDQLSQQPLAVEPNEGPVVIPADPGGLPYTVPSQDRWNPGLNDLD